MSEKETDITPFEFRVDEFDVTKALAELLLNMRDEQVTGEITDWTLSMEAVEDGTLVFTGTIETRHEHEWGPIERSLFAGTFVRRCTSIGCSFVTLDLDDEDFNPEEYGA